MSKPKLLFRTQDMPNFNSGWILPLVVEHFDLVEYDPVSTYSRDYSVLTVYQQDFEAEPWYRHLEQAGHKIVLDHLFDSDTATASFKMHDTKLDLRSPHWMWYHTAILAAHNGYDAMRFEPAYRWDFLCLMNKQRDHRDRVMHELAQPLESARWSYVDRGREIGDCEERATPVFWEYYNNPDWYNSTCWSLVVESYMRSDAWFRAPEYPNYRTEISEKSYKPMAYYHPAVVCGSVDTLKFLRSQGFETWDNLWDESYDGVPEDAARCDTVLNLVRDVVKTYNRDWGRWDLTTQLKLEHNHARFFDLDLVRRRFRDEIIADVLEFIS